VPERAFFPFVLFVKNMDGFNIAKIVIVICEFYQIELANIIVLLCFYLNLDSNLRDTSFQSRVTITNTREMDLRVVASLNV